MATLEKPFDGGLFDGTTNALLGIDPSLTGFGLTALSVQDDTYFTWVYTSPKRGVDRLLDIVGWMEERIWKIAESRDIVDAAIEGGVVQSQSAFVLGELHGVVKASLTDLPVGDGQYPLQIPPTSLKKYVSGKGTGVKKSEMLLKTYRKWRAEFTDDNASDSYGLARLLRHLREIDEGGNWDAASYEVDVLLKLSQSKFRDTVHAPIA